MIILQIVTRKESCDSGVASGDAWAQDDRRERKLRLREMLPAGGGERLEFAVGELQFDLSAARDGADAGDGGASDCGGNGFGSGRGEKQFVVFAAVQGELTCVAGASGGNSGAVNDRADAAFIADVAKIGGESVAGVDHGGSQLVLAQVSTESDTRIGIEVTNMPSRPQLLSCAKFFQRGERGAEGSADINDVAGARAGAKH